MVKNFNAEKPPQNKRSSSLEYEEKNDTLKKYVSSTSYFNWIIIPLISDVNKAATHSWTVVDVGQQK